MDSVPSICDAARAYIAHGWSPVPVPKDSKGADLSCWQKLRVREGQVDSYFDDKANIGLILGEASGELVDVDLDCPEAVELADDFLPPTPAITGRSSKPGSHRWYYADVPKTKQYRDPVINKMVVELRSNGGQTVVGPSVHPDGDRYDLLTAEPARVAGPMLAACVEAIFAAVLKLRYPAGVPTKPRPAMTAPTSPRRAIDSAEAERRAIAYLAKMPPAISGQGGHNATYAAAVAIAWGFAIEPERALQILLEEYNPRCEPPWTEKELAHKVSDAGTKPHDNPKGWLLYAELPELQPKDDDVDISALIGPLGEDSGPPDDRPEDQENPGPTPEQLLDVPGFVHDVMQYNLENAAYPDRAMAFAGALSLQALLAGRKVRDAGNSRTSLYVVALANSGVGKDFPRRTNEQILMHAGVADWLGDEIGSSEGLLDDLEIDPNLLLQTDEIDYLMQAMNQPKESRYQRILQALLKLFTSASGVYTKRKKVKKDRGHIIQPNVCLYGTAIPKEFFQSLSMKMLTNGWFARLLILESSRRSEGRDNDEVADIPESIIERGQWWVALQPGGGNLSAMHPDPLRIAMTETARAVFRAFRKRTNDEYRRGEECDNQAMMAIWARAVEKAKRLALIYACSENHVEPVIGESAADWACRLIEHQTRRMLFMAGLHVSDSDFEAKCKQVVEVLHRWRDQQGDDWMPFRDVSRKLRWSKRDHDEIRATLLQQEQIEYDTIKTNGRPRQSYRLPVHWFKD